MSTITTLIIVMYAAIIPLLFYFSIYPFYRKFHVGQVVWLRGPHVNPKRLVVIKEKPENYPTVQWVMPIGKDHPGMPSPFWDYKGYCAGSQELRPIRWWQRNYTDPIIAAHYLLSGM
jgi:hypothetical protein